MSRREQVLQVLRANPGCTARELAALLPGWRPAHMQLRPMLLCGLVRRTGRGWSADPFRWYAKNQEPMQIPEAERTHHVIIHVDGRIELFGWDVPDIAEFVTLLHARRSLTTEDRTHAH